MKKTADKRTKKPHFKIDFSSATLTLSPKVEMREKNVHGGEITDC